MVPCVNVSLPSAWSGLAIIWHQQDTFVQITDTPCIVSLVRCVKKTQQINRSECSTNVQQNSPRRLFMFWSEMSLRFRKLNSSLCSTRFLRSEKLRVNSALEATLRKKHIKVVKTNEYGINTVNDITCLAYMAKEKKKPYHPGGWRLQILYPTRLLSWPQR